jgi:hypothetical protein
VDGAAAEVVAIRNCVTDALSELSGLGLASNSLVSSPSRWLEDLSPFDADGPSTAGWVGHLLGVAATVLALFLGAPFWFDLIKRLTGLRKGLVGDA